MEKQRIKQSEARIMVYLSVVHNTRKTVTHIAHKLEMDYSYTMRILQSMHAKQWLKKHKYRRFMFYDLTDTAPLTLAKQMYLTEALQQKLETDNSTQEELKNETTKNIL
jgi:predicted transcriptional regulator